MSTLDYIYRQLRDACNGRIDTTPGCWVFSPTKADIEKVLTSVNPHVHESIDGTGQKIYLIKKRAVFCHNPAVGEGEYPKSSKRKIWFIPWSVCRKCDYYRKTTRKRRYIVCDWVRQQRGGDAGAARETANLLTNAISQANKIMGSS